MTATFIITPYGTFLPVQLIYQGKSSQVYPRVDFPTNFSLFANPKYYTNCQESKKVINGIIVPYLPEKRYFLGTERRFPGFIDHG